jgi:lysine-specific demethylase 8
MSGRDVIDVLARAVRRNRPPEPPSLPRLRRPSKERFVEFRRAKLPVLLEGLTDDWPNRGRWSLASLRERFADRTVSVVPTRDGRLAHDADVGMPFNAFRFGEYIDRLERGDWPNCYVATPADTWLPELNEDVRVPEYCSDAPWRISRFWVGPPHTSAPLHRDVAENIFVQLVGRKRFLLWPPAATHWLYSYPLRSALPNYSRFDPERPDYDRFPLCRFAQPLEVVLEPGDAMYLPSRWWHQVHALDVSMSYTFWWAYGALSVAVRAAELIKRVRSLEVFGLENRLRTDAKIGAH